MSGDVAERAPRGGGKGLRRPKRRISILIDMTPMVDIAFLLLIFYMVSTVFAMPQAMEINLPPKEQEEEIEVKESNLLTIRVDGESRFWWHLKAATPDNLPLLLPSLSDIPDSVVYTLDGDTLRGMMVAKNRDNDKLSTLVLIHPDATYADFVNFLDEIDIIERSWNAYTANQKGVKVEELEREEKFSYRYAVGEWEDRDDKIMSVAIKAAEAAGEL